MNCDTFREQLANLIAGELDPEQRAAAQRHMQACERCRALARGLQAAAAAVESGVLSPDEAERRTGDLTFPAARRPLPRGEARTYPRVSRILRYAAAVLIAFAGGYLARGLRIDQTANPPGQRPQPELVTRQFLDRYAKAASEFPQSSSFSRSLLVLAPR